MPSDTAPNSVTITLAIVAWLFTSTIDEILKAPYLVYSVNSTTNTSNKSLVDTTVTLTNITHDKSYRNLVITLVVDQPDEINLNYPHGVRPEQPGWEGDDPPSIGKSSFQHTFPIIQPDGQFHIIFTHNGPDTRYIHLALKYPDGKVPETILLTSRNFTAWVAEYHLLLSISFILILSLLSIYFWLNRRKSMLPLEVLQE